MAEAPSSVSADTQPNSLSFQNNNSNQLKNCETATAETSETAQLSNESKMVPTLPSFSKHIKQGIPLLLLLIFNLIYSHTIYFALFVGLLVVFDWSNDIIVRQTTLQNRRSLWSLLFIVLFLIINTVLLFPIIDTFWLCNLSTFTTWLSSPSFFWTVLFNIVLMDFIIKFITLSAKCCIIIPKDTVIETHTRGGCFVLLEALSQLIRCFMPVPEWIKYILNSSACVVTIMCWFVAALYCAIKLYALKSKLHLLKCGWHSWKHPEVIGRPLVLADEVKSLQPCPICREKCKNPVALSCDHVFCRSCCQTWFDWDKHCPVCSSNAVYSLVFGQSQRMPSLLQISSKNSTLRRGNTDYLVQIF